MPTGESDRGQILAEFIASELADEKDRSARLREAASKLLTASAAFVALIITLASLVLGEQFVLRRTGLVGWLLIAAIAGIAGSAVFAARAQGLQSVDRPSAEALFKLLEKTWWRMTAAQARSVAARHNVMTIQSLRAANNRRASSLKVALILQGVGLAAVVITIVQGIWSQPSG